MCLREVAQKGLGCVTRRGRWRVVHHLAEMAMSNGLGFDIVTDDEVRLDGFLFEKAKAAGGQPERGRPRRLLRRVEAHGLQPTLLGHVTKGKVVVDDKHFGFCEELRAYYDNALEEILTEEG